MTTLLIDSDTIAFAAAATCEDHEDPTMAYARAKMQIDGILEAVQPTHYELWLTGLNNFRFQVYPEYKDNRREAYRPKWEKAVKELLVGSLGAQWTEGCEADDMVGVRQMELQDSIIAHIDKDIDMIPGRHYSWPLIREQKVIREPRFYDITEEEGLRFFYTQLLTGDPTDNIKGAAGIGPVKAKRLLQDALTEFEMYHTCVNAYASIDEMIMNAKCLWIWRRLNDDVTERWKEFELD